MDVILRPNILDKIWFIKKERVALRSLQREIIAIKKKTTLDLMRLVGSKSTTLRSGMIKF